MQTGRPTFGRLVDGGVPDAAVVELADATMEELLVEAAVGEPGGSLQASSRATRTRTTRVQHRWPGCRRACPMGRSLLRVPVDEHDSIPAST